MAQWSDKAKRQNANRGVPYDRLEEAIEVAKQQYPGADKYVPVWHDNSCLVEVWNKGHAKVYVIFGPMRGLME